MSRALRGRKGERDFRGEKRANEAHVSTTSLRLSSIARPKEGGEALSYIGNAMTENRHGLVAETDLDRVSRTIEARSGQDVARAALRSGKQSLQCGQVPRRFVCRHLYLVAIMDRVSRKARASRRSNTMDTEFCIEAPEEVISG